MCMSACVIIFLCCSLSKMIWCLFTSCFPSLLVSSHFLYTLVLCRDQTTQYFCHWRWDLCQSRQSQSHKLKTWYIMDPDQSQCHTQSVWGKLKGNCSTWHHQQMLGLWKNANFEQFIIAQQWSCFHLFPSQSTEREWMCGWGAYIQYVCRGWPCTHRCD